MGVKPNLGEAVFVYYHWDRANIPSSLEKPIYFNFFFAGPKKKKENGKFGTNSGTMVEEGQFKAIRIMVSTLDM